jgi:hypothetical protein
MRSFSSALNPSQEKLDEAIRLLSDPAHSEPGLLLIRTIALALRKGDPLQTVDVFRSLPRFLDLKSECRRLYWTMRTMWETDQEGMAHDYAREAIDILWKGLSTDFVLPLGSLAGLILRDPKLILQLVTGYCKTRPLSPYPYIYMATQVGPEAGFKLMSDLVRTNVPNIVDCFHFDYKPPVLMARPEDEAQVRHQMLRMWVETASASGNYVKLFPLFHPSGKMDQRASRATKTIRLIFGVDRVEIFELYVSELIKVVEKKLEKSHLDSNLTERILDALGRGQQVDISNLGKDLLTQLLYIAWKALLGKDPTPESSVNELMKQRIDTEEEDGEEKDEDFVDSEPSGTEGKTSWSQPISTQSIEGSR